MRNPLPFLLAVLLVSPCVFGASKPVSAGEVSDTASCRVVNLMPLFWRFWDAARNQPESAQVELFDQMVVREHPEVYREAVLRPGHAESDLKAQIADFLRGAPADIAAMRSLSDSLDGLLPLSLSGFQKAFPDFACRNSIYFLVSLGAFDGSARTVNGEPALLIGVDVTARIHPPEEVGALLDHELFHLYHRQVTGVAGGMGDPLYRVLWEEGLATYASGVLNPGVSENAILGRPQDLAARAESRLPEIARALLQNMDSTSPDLYAAFFLGNSGQSEVPSRSGYYVGYRIARELGQSQSLRQLAQMNGEALRATIRSRLQQMAH